MRVVNPWNLRNFFSDKCDQKIEKLITISKNGFSFKFKPIRKLNLSYDIKKFEDFSCEITFYIFLNQTKGIIYIRNHEIYVELKKKLKEPCPFIKNAIETVYMKSRTLTLRQYFLPSTCKNSHIVSTSPDNYQIPLCWSTKTDVWYVIIATNTDTQKQDADEKEFAEIAKKTTTQVTKLINAQMNLSVKTVEKDTRQEIITSKLK